MSPFPQVTRVSLSATNFIGSVYSIYWPFKLILAILEAVREGTTAPPTKLHLIWKVTSWRIWKCEGICEGIP